jgi:hypothetical protein
MRRIRNQALAHVHLAGADLDLDLTGAEGAVISAPLRPTKGEFESLRLAARAADRSKAARQEWPAFEERLKELGYGPRAIAHAFSSLSGPDTMAEAQDVLKRHDI